MKQEIKFIERQVKSYLTIGQPSSKGFVYTRELIEDVLKQQQPLIDDKTLFVTLGYTGDSITDTDFDKVEGFVTKAEITEDNKVTYTIQVAGQCPYFIYDYKEEDIIGLKEK